MFGLIRICAAVMAVAWAGMVPAFAADDEDVNS